jgi:hypothetical protein
MRTGIFLLLPIALFSGGCGSSPDGDCYTDFDCEEDQVCGLGGKCLLCENCQRGVISTCTAPAWPRPGAPEEIRIDSYPDQERLIYLYTCPGAVTEYRYHRTIGERCFETDPYVDDGCNFEE